MIARLSPLLMALSDPFARQATFHWFVVARSAQRTSAGALVLLGDGIKVAKEAERMPGVKKLHQESDNSGISSTLRYIE